MKQRNTPESVIIPDDDTCDALEQSLPQALAASTPAATLNYPHKHVPSLTSPKHTISHNNTTASSQSLSHTVTSISRTFIPSPPTPSIHKPSPVPHTPTNPTIVTQSLPNTCPSIVTPSADHHAISSFNTRPSPIQSTFSTPPFHVPSQPPTNYTNTNTPLSHRHHNHSISFTSMLEDDLELQELGIQQNQGTSSSEVSSEWTSFTTHFTHQFEELKAEVEGLRSEVKHLKRTVRELKVRKEKLITE